MYIYNYLGKIQKTANVAKRIGALSFNLQMVLGLKNVAFAKIFKSV
jgi:hypothetical protein